MHGSDQAYGLWTLVIVNSLVFIFFAFSFVKPKSSTDWRSLGAFSAFIVALFVEMYGFPLTVYLLSGWLGSRFPGLTLSHDAGHLWYALLGLKGDAHLSPIHIGSNLLIFGGLWLVWAGWRGLHEAQREGRLATTGLYARLQHPQYLGFVMVMVGFLLMWPTIPTLLMFPILLVVYARLARREEALVEAEHGDAWRAWAAHTPRFIPRLSASADASPHPPAP